MFEALRERDNAGNPSSQRWQGRYPGDGSGKFDMSKGGYDLLSFDNMGMVPYSYDEETNTVIIHIGETRYRMKESIEGRLEINKHDLDDTDISVKPQYANQITIK